MKPIEEIENHIHKCELEMINGKYTKSMGNRFI